MLGYLILTFIIFSIFAVLILVGLGRNPNQAVRIVAGFWKTIFIDLLDELFGNHTQITYPFIFGLDLIGNFDPDQAEADFEDLYRVFEKGDIFLRSIIMYPEDNTVSKDIVCYTFRVRIEDTKDLEKIKEKITMRINCIVNRRLKKNGYFYAASSPFVFWSFNSDKKPTFLNIYFALTSKGVKSIRWKKLQMEYERQKKNQKSSTNFKTDWKSGESKDGKY